MKISIFLKTFLTILFSFVLLFVITTFYFYNLFPDKYVEENIEVVKNAILESAYDLSEDVSLASTILIEATSETQYIRFKDNQVSDMIGPIILQEYEILEFVINIYDNDDLNVEGDLSYTIEEAGDVYTISYFYRLDSNDYLLVITKIQSLSNIDQVLRDITISQGIFIIVMVLLLSLIISSSFTRPINKINKYAKSIARLDFSEKLRIRRSDELMELTSSLNEMVFNLQKTYTELKQANSKLEGDIEFEKLQEEKKKNLIMTINHELKTPVAVIKGMVEGMIDEVGRYKNKKTYLKQVLNQLDKIESMTKDLTYSLKLEDIAKVNDLTNTKIIKDSIGSLRELAKQNRVHLNENIKDYPIKINPELLSILVTNLLKNAINYTEDYVVYLKVYKEKNKVIIEIKNCGVISAPDLEKIFEPYYRVRIEKEGSGLGLFIVKQICEIYKAEYKIYNDNGYVVSKIIFND